MLSIKFIAIIVAIVMTAGTTLTMITVVITGMWVSNTAQVTVAPGETPDSTATPDGSDDNQGNNDNDDDDDGNVGATPVNTSTTNITPTATITPTMPMSPTTGVTVTVPITSSPIIDIITIIIGFNDYFDRDDIEIDLNIDFGLVPGHDSGSSHHDDDDGGSSGGSSSGDHNKGHGNDADGHDEDNPGNSRHDDQARCKWRYVGGAQT